MMRRQIALSICKALRKVKCYCDLSVAEFEREIADGRLPMPVKLGNSEHWSKMGLDRALEQLAGGADNDWRTKLGLYNAA
jgi:predicted DNA-binding transcriptional regulator AlpA